MRLKPGDHIVDYVDDALQGLLSEEDASYLKSHIAQCTTCLEAWRKAEQRISIAKNVPAPQTTPPQVESPRAKIQAAAELQTLRQSNIRWWTIRCVATAILFMAIYHIRLATLQPSTYDLRLLGQQQLLAGAPASIRVQLSENNAPVQGALINLDLDDPRTSRTAKLASYTTNSAGTGSPQFTLPDWPDGDYSLRAIAAVGAHTETLTQTVALRHEARLLLTTDKPLYQPGQTLHARALALSKPDLKPVAAHEILFSLTDPKGNLVFEQTGFTSTFGIASADCPLDNEILEGTYTLLCRAGAVETSSTIDIKHYALPKFNVQLTTDKHFYGPGDRVRATIQADYFFHQPVANASLKLTVNSDQIDLQSAPSQPSRTDAAGHAVLEFVLPESLAAAADASVLVTITVTDSAQQQQSRDLALPVTKSPIHIELIPESGHLVWSPNAANAISNRIYVLTTYADGRPAKTRLHISGLIERPLATNDLGVAVFELTPRSEMVPLDVKASDASGLSSMRHFDLTAGSDYFIRTDKPVYHAGDSVALEVLGSGSELLLVDLLQDGQTHRTSTVQLSDGRGTATIPLTPGLTGTLELSIYRYGLSGLDIHQSHFLYVQPADPLQIHASLDHPQYRPGDTAHLAFHLTNARGSPAPGALSLVAVDEAVFSLLDLPAGQATPFTLDRKLLQPAYAIYPAGPAVFSTDPDHQLLNEAFFAGAVAGTLDRNTLIARLIQKGYLSPHTLRYLDTAWGQHLLQEQIEESGVSADLKAALLNNGPFTLNANTGVANIRMAEASARQRDDLIPLLWGATIILSLLALIYAFAPNRLLAAIVLLVVGELLVAIMLPSLGKAREMSNRSVAAADARGLVQALQLDQQQAGPAAVSGNVPTPPHLRHFFPETLLWQPELITDDQGNATLDIPLADSITTWRLSSSAVTAAGDLASSQTPIRAFQPFFVDLNLPAYLTRGDEISIPAAVYNYLDTPQTVTLTLAHTEGFELLDSASQSVQLLSGEVKSVHFRIRALKAGTHTLHLAAQATGPAGASSDALERSLEVLPEGHLTQTSVSTLSRDPVDIRLNIPASVIDGSLRAAVKIYPSNFSQLVEGLDSVFQMPDGCFEQTSSTTYPDILALAYLKQTKTSSPKIEATARRYIQLGYQHLLTFEIPGGGFDWFGRPPANPTLTAYGLMEFQDLATVQPIDANLIPRTRKWLLAQQLPDGSWPLPSQRFYHDDPTALGDAKIANTAYIAWSVFSGNSNDAHAAPAQQFLHAQGERSKSNAYTAALVANALLAINPHDASARDLLDFLESSRQSSPDQKQVHWSLANDRSTTFYGAGRSADIETTALTALAMVHSSSHIPTAHAALRWLVSQKDPNGTWYSTQASILTFKALLASSTTSTGNQEQRRIDVQLDGKVIHEFHIPADKSDLVASFDLSPFINASSAQSSLRLIPQPASDVTYQVTTRYNLPQLETANPPATLQIQLAYDHTLLQLGDQVDVTATLHNTSSASLRMVMIDLPIPPGFSADTAALETLQSAGAIEKYQTTSRRIIVYLAGIEPGGTQTYHYTLRALMPERVHAPNADAYEYYQPEDHAEAGETQLEVQGDERW